MDDKIWYLIEKYMDFPDEVRRRIKKPSKLLSRQFEDGAVIGSTIRLSADEADKPFIEVYERTGGGVTTHRKTLTESEVERLFDELISLYNIPRHSYYVEIKMRVGETPRAKIATYLLSQND